MCSRRIRTAQLDPSPWRWRRRPGFPEKKKCRPGDMHNWRSFQSQCKTRSPVSWALFETNTMYIRTLLYRIFQIYISIYTHLTKLYWARNRDYEDKLVTENTNWEQRFYLLSIQTEFQLSVAIVQSSKMIQILEAIYVHKRLVEGHFESGRILRSNVFERLVQHHSR